jgi:hypothetical protein
MVTAQQTLVLIERGSRQPTVVPEGLRARVRGFEGADLEE